MPNLILIVEDEPLLRMLAVELAEDADFQAFEAANAAEALSLLEANPDVQVLLTDIDMPGGLDGLMLARIACKRLPSIEIIVVSGMRPPNADELPSGGISYNKPYDFGAMTTQLQRMCQRRRRLPSDSERSSPLGLICWPTC